MSSTQERIQKRRQYLKRRVAIYAWACLSGLLITLGFVFSLVNHSSRSPIVILAIFLVGQALIVTAVIILEFAGKKAKQLSFVPPVTADTLPAEEVLVRGSKEPAQEQSKVLLRGTDGSEGTAEQELLRSSQPE